MNGNHIKPVPIPSSTSTAKEKDANLKKRKRNRNKFRINNLVGMTLNENDISASASAPAPAPAPVPAAAPVPEVRKQKPNADSRMKGNHGREGQAIANHGVKAGDGRSADATASGTGSAVPGKGKTKRKRSNNRFQGVDKSRAGSKLLVSSKQSLVQEKSFAGLTKAVAMDCEMVGVGERGSHSVLARISLVNLFGHCVYDKYVKPTERVTDYRTFVSGIRPHNLVDGEHFQVVQKEICDILKGRILVGHAVKHDLQVLYLDHPRRLIRDTSKYFKFTTGGKTPSLKKLSEKLLGVNVQVNEHDSVEDAQATMRLYTLYKRKWEAEIKQKQKRHFPQKPEARDDHHTQEDSSD